MASIQPIEVQVNVRMPISVVGRLLLAKERNGNAAKDPDLQQLLSDAALMICELSTAAIVVPDKVTDNIDLPKLKEMIDKYQQNVMRPIRINPSVEETVPMNVYDDACKAARETVKSLEQRLREQGEKLQLMTEDRDRLRDLRIKLNVQDQVGERKPAPEILGADDLRIPKEAIEQMTDKLRGLLKLVGAAAVDVQGYLEGSRKSDVLETLRSVQDGINALPIYFGQPRLDVEKMKPFENSALPIEIIINGRPHIIKAPTLTGHAKTEMRPCGCEVVYGYKCPNHEGGPTERDVENEPCPARNRTNAERLPHQFNEKGNCICGAHLSCTPTTQMKETVEKTFIGQETDIRYGGGEILHASVLDEKCPKSPGGDLPPVHVYNDKGDCIHCGHHESCAPTVETGVAGTPAPRPGSFVQKTATGEIIRSDAKIVEPEEKWGEEEIIPRAQNAHED